MSRFTAFVKRHAIWGGLLAVLLPFSVLLALEYRWLQSLERASAMAHRISQTAFLQTVVKDVEVFYGNRAERCLALPYSLFRPDRIAQASAYFSKKDLEGMQTIFVVLFDGSEAGTLLEYDPATETMRVPAPSPVTRAITLASAHFRLLSDRAIPVDATTPVVDENDPAHRLILFPVADLTARIVGVTGVVVDADHFRRSLLPQLVDRTLSQFFAAQVRANTIVAARDASGNPVFRTDAASGQADEVSLPFSFVFQDWKISVRSRTSTPEQLARANFRLNMGLTVALAVLLLSGLALALRLAYRELRLSEMKAGFVSNVSHELRTPLASIRLFGELLRNGRVTDPAKVREYGEYIDNESRRLTQLINNILDFSRIETGRKRYHFAKADLAAVAAGVVRAFQVPIHLKGIELHLDAATPVPATMMDPDAVAQALHNLLDNAVKYSGDGRHVWVRVWHDRISVHASVRDEGIGIARNEQDRIFDPFHRVSVGLVHDVKGSGLGLSIVRHVMDAHDGRITVQSEPGHGSTFTFSIPIKAARASAQAAITAPIPAAPSAS